MCFQEQHFTPLLMMMSSLVIVGRKSPTQEVKIIWVKGPTYVLKKLWANSRIVCEEKLNELIIV